VDERDDEDVAAAQLIEDTPGVDGHFAQVLIAKFRNFATCASLAM
jgi:hypothetical protein